MRPSTAAGLVGAAMLSTLVYPFVGLALRTPSEADAGEDEAGPPDQGPSPLGGGPVVQPGLAA